ncbi:XRE family transcriptional regulator [Legionella geestiana]|uniref:XRE family transcriptional regulator n=1 Tax=Legionella geestiana TaxID=45065 RepID=A0A0W0TNN4_9GAMM|nr:helix-turn-helix transcriptional regulator [Legionella geestiana]KTC97216.1 XRE family transcriptional regulator [Legionella geestiana]QBS12350.1 transcriptional regulator [Legionella geestiana]QDQ39938.1 helix-turn-helix transcriptional regulator [Legionella geestiana]STX55213.1 XRE family transcriptional regulator [Legionella geestiana]
MAIIVELDVMLARRKMKLQELSRAVGITIQNLSILKNGKARAIRIETLNAICEALQCQPGDILRFECSMSENGHERRKEKSISLLTKK